MGNGVLLMLPQLYLRVHARKDKKAAIILTGTGTVHKFVVLLYQRFPAPGVFPHPILKGVLDCLLLLCCKGSLFGIKDSALLALIILYGIIDAHITQVQCVLHDLIGIGAPRAEGRIGHNIRPIGRAFPGDVPFRCQGRILHLDITLHIKRRLKGFVHELLENLFVYPCAADADFDLTRVQVFGLRLFQRLHVDVKIRVPFCRALCLAQLLPHSSFHRYPRSQRDRRTAP